MVFHVFYLNMMPFCMPEKLQKWIVPFLLLPNFGRITRPHTPHFSALYTPKLHLCTFVLMPETPFSHTLKPYLAYPILPFGMSHFAFWDIPFCLLGYPISPFGVYFRHICAQRTAPMPDLASSFFAAKYMCFLSTHVRLGTRIGKDFWGMFCYICLIVARISRCKQCVTCKPVSEFLYLPLSIF